MGVVWLVGLGVFGLLVGWFLNVVIVRLPGDESLLGPPSRCVACEAPIRARDNVPVVSWLALGGRCRACGEAIAAGYPLVEAGNALLWVVTGAVLGLSWVTLPYLVLASVLLTQSVIDLELYRLLDKITYPAIVFSVPALALVSVTLDDPAAALIGAAIGGVGYFAFLFIPALIYPRGMGLGDVKLAGLMGLYLGLINPVLVLFALILASVAGIVAGGILYLARGRRSEAFPFGPWLALGCLVTIWTSDIWLAPYTG